MMADGNSVLGILMLTKIGFWATREKENCTSGAPILKWHLVLTDSPKSREAHETADRHVRAIFTNVNPSAIPPCTGQDVLWLQKCALHLVGI